MFAAISDSAVADGSLPSLGRLVLGTCLSKFTLNLSVVLLLPPCSVSFSLTPRIIYSLTIHQEYLPIICTSGEVGLSPGTAHRVRCCLTPTLPRWMSYRPAHGPETVCVVAVSASMALLSLITISYSVRSSGPQRSARAPLSPQTSRGQAPYPQHYSPAPGIAITRFTLPGSHSQ